MIYIPSENITEKERTRPLYPSGFNHVKSPHRHNHK